MNKKVTAQVIKGYGVASGKALDSPYPAGTISLQQPYFRNLGLDLYHLHPATLNLSVAPKQMQVVNPKYTFRKVNWIDGYPPEDFSFSECKILFCEKLYKGYIYYPRPETKIGHFQSPSVVEVICQSIPAISYGSTVELVYLDQEINIA